MSEFMSCFIPLFVAIDPLGAVPLYLGLTEGMPAKEARRVIALTVSAALALALAFLFLGKGIFSFLGISENDFKIGGGIILLIIALKMVLEGHGGLGERSDRAVGIVPLGVPLIVGPASITTLLMQIDAHPFGHVLASLMANMAVVVVVFMLGRRIADSLGDNGMRALSKIIGLFLAAIAVMMIRVGLQEAFGLKGM